MADKAIVGKAISDLTQALQITNEDLFVLEQSGEAKKLKGETLLNFITLSVVSVTVTTLPAGSSATATYDKANNTLALGIPKGDKGDNGPMPASFVVPLPKSGWNGKMQTVSNDKFLATGYVYTVRPDGSSFADSEMAGVHSDNVIEDGKMIFYCNTIPETDLTMNVLRMEVTT